MSLRQITGREVELEQALRDVCNRIEAAVLSLEASGNTALHDRYLSALYRNDGLEHRFLLPSGEYVDAAIADVLPTGMLVLRHSDGSTGSYAFKEVAFVI